MAATVPPTHVSNKSFHYSISPQPYPLPSPRSSTLTLKSKQSLCVRCALSPPNRREGRRLLSISLALSQLFFIPKSVTAGSLWDKYVKRKKLEPLEVYVPAVILAQLQIKDLDKTLDVDQPQYASCRSLLRAGPAASLRVNIRAVFESQSEDSLKALGYISRANIYGMQSFQVAQYASDSGNGKTASNDVDQCLRALEELDSLLLHASRNDPEASVKSMKAKIITALNALDSLLQTVPSNVLSKGKEIADSYRIPEDDETESLGPELKQLESIL